MNKKTYFKKMLKDINNIYVYIGKNPIKIDRNNKEHRLLLTSKKYRKRSRFSSRSSVDRL